MGNRRGYGSQLRRGAGKPLILIVDDSPTIRYSLKCIFASEFSLLEALDGEQAWQLVDENPAIEVVLTDIDMPALDGFGLIKRMRNSSDSRIRNLPVMVLTGNDDSVAREQAFYFGANDFVTKVSDRIELCARLRAQCKLAQTIRQLEESRRELREQANTDTLTGLPNRRFFSQVAQKELSLSRRNEKSFAVLMLDLDHFKGINDSHGHAAGDHVLREVAVMLASSIREEDVVARIGGEEFAVCAPYTDACQARVIAENLRKAAELLQVSYAGKKIPVTLSIGLAVMPQDGDDLLALMGVADGRLYLAKQDGRNRFCASDAPLLQQHTRPRQEEPPSPGIDEALLMLRQGRHEHLLPHLTGLLEELLPLFELASRQAENALDVQQLRNTIESLQP